MLRLACGRLIWIKSRNIKHLIDIDVHFRGRLIWINDDPCCDTPPARSRQRLRDPGNDGRDCGGGAAHTGRAIEYFTWLSAKLLSIEAMPSSRVSFDFRNAS